ncbi:MAG: CHAT domain-containing tetratricopeptide repeat protein [Cyclobacteriaceae bacterium]
MLRAFAIILIYSATIPVGSSQALSDSTVVKVIMADGMDLLLNSQHEESISKYEEAKHLAEELGLVVEFVQSEIRIITNLWRLYNLDAAGQRAVKLLSEAKSLLGDDDYDVGEVYFQIGVVKMYEGKFDSSILYYNESIAIKSKYGDRGLPGLSAVYVNMGYIYLQLGDMEKTLETYYKAYETDRKIHGDDHLFVAEDLQNIAAILIYRSDYQNAVEYLDRAHAILNTIGNRGGIYTTVLTSYGNAYNGLNQLSKSSEYLTLSLRNNIEIYGKEHFDHTSIYQGLGESFLRQDLLDSSLYYFRKVLDFEDELRKSNINTLLFTLRGMAYALKEMENYREALSVGQNTLKLAHEISEQNEYIPLANNDLGRIYQKMGNYDMSKKYYLTSIEYLSKNYEVMRSLLLVTYKNLAEVHFANGDWQKALQAVQKSIKANFSDWMSDDLLSNPPKEGFLDPKSLLTVLDIKTKVLSIFLEKNHSVIYEEALLDTYELLYEIINDERRSISRVDDKVRLLDFGHSIYEKAINANLDAFVRSNDGVYLEDCFKFSEADKSAILLESLKTIDAGKWSSVSEEVVAKEEDVRRNLSYYSTALIEEKNKLDDADSAKIVLYESKLFNFKSSQDSIVRILQQEYPDYYKLKYNRISPAISDIQNSLDSDEALIEYFIGDSATYVFVITDNDYIVRELGPSAELVNDVSSFRRMFRKVTEKGEIDDDIGKFIDVSLRLYNKLISPIKVHLADAKSLIIVPGGPVHYLPFDLLLSTDPAAQDGNYKSLPYLLKDYNIQNAHSASIEFLRPVKTGNTEGVLSFAPSYTSFDEELPQLSDLGQFRNAIIPLKWNKNEVEQIGKIVASTSFSNRRATEGSFKENANDFKVLHLAMHAFVDNEKPMNSKLLFTTVTDSIEDGMLHTFELYNMRLNADLVVLSACETGYGKLITGDGIMSLARGFAYAGVPSVVMSHWQVDDQSTSILMESFYKNLAEGLQKSEALRTAKLDFLENAGPNKEHPFFWGAFVVLGDDSPVFKNNYQSIYYFVGLFLALLILGSAFYARRSKSIKN